MKSYKFAFVIIVSMSLASGCAGKPMAKTAFRDPAQAVSIPHPVESEKKQVQFITNFSVFMDPALWSEMDPSGSGTFPVVGLKGYEKIPGYCVYSGLTYWGDFTLRCSIERSEQDLEGIKFILQNRDSGYAFSLAGIETSLLRKSETDLVYKVEAFDKDQEFCAGFFHAYGMDLRALKELWRIYIASHGKDPGDYQIVEEIAVGSHEWDEYKRTTAKIFPNVFQMPDGQLRCSKMNLDEFRDHAVEIPGFNGSQRFIKRATLPVLSIASGGFGWAPMAAAGLAGDAIAAGIDDSWSGFYARAEAVRYSLAPALRRISADYKALLIARDAKLQALGGH
jgi:hypothetical protein